MADITLPTPGVTPGPQWATMLVTAISEVNESLGDISFQIVTQAQYDAIPLPRPADVIYIIKP